jgi:hypothetical protein
MKEARDFVVLLTEVWGTKAIGQSRELIVVPTLAQAKKFLATYVNTRARGTVKFGRNGRTATYGLGDAKTRVFIKRRKVQHG